MTDDTQRTERSIWARPDPKPSQPSAEQETADQTTSDESQANEGADPAARLDEQPTTPDPASGATTADPTTEGPTPEGARAEPAAGPVDAAAAVLPFDVPQPPVWEPSDADLDPTSNAGWDRAADHELVAVRPENVPAILAVASAGLLDPATARDVVSGKPVEEAIAAQGLDGEAGASEGSMAAADRPAGSAVEGFASPFGGGHGMPATTPQRARPAEPVMSTEGSPAVAASDLPAEATLAAVPAVSAEAESPAIPGSAPMSNVIAFPQTGPDTALAPSERRWRRGARRARSGLESAARPVLLLALFVLGTSVGWTSYLATRPAPAPAAPAAQVVDSAATDSVPPQVQSLVAALNSGNQSQVQTVVPADAYRLLAGELASNNVQSIRAAKAQATYTAGRDSATEILIAATTLDGQNFTFNLVVHLHNGVIIEFR